MVLVYESTIPADLAVRSGFDSELAHLDHGGGECGRPWARGYRVEDGGRPGGLVTEKHLVGLQHASSIQQIRVVCIVKQIGSGRVEVYRRGRVRALMWACGG